MIPLHALPTVNAALNATSAVLLLVGWGLIKAKRVRGHAAAMLAAVGVSTLFLASYLTYHAHVGSVRFPGTGGIRPVYLTLLLTHTLLAIAIVPLVIRTVFLASQRRDEQHRRLARVTHPLWLYVSVTGVAIYWLLYQSPWGVGR